MNLKAVLEGILFIVGRQRNIETLSILTNVVPYKNDLREGVNNFVDQDRQMIKGEKEAIKLALDILSDSFL